MFDTLMSWNDLLFMIKGTGVTLAITFWAVLGGTILGIALGLIRSVAPWWINFPLGGVLDVLRSIPLLIQFILGNSLQAILGWHLSAFTVGCVVLGLYTMSYCTEVVRGGVLSVPTTTRRAARSLGLTYSQDLTQIVFPLALRVALPSWIGLTLGVLKDSALVLWIGIVELLRSSQIIITRIQEPLFVLTVAGLIYFIISFPIARVAAQLEKRWQEND